MGLAFIPVIIAKHPGWQLLMFSSYTAAWAMIIAWKQPWLIFPLTALDSMILVVMSLISGWSMIEVKDEHKSSSQDAVGQLTMVLLGMVGTQLVCTFSFFAAKNLAPEMTNRLSARVSGVFRSGRGSEAYSAGAPRGTVAHLAQYTKGNLPKNEDDEMSDVDDEAKKNAAKNSKPVTGSSGMPGRKRSNSILDQQPQGPGWILTGAGGDNQLHRATSASEEDDLQTGISSMSMTKEEKERRKSLKRESLKISPEQGATASITSNTAHSA